MLNLSCHQAYDFAKKDMPTKFRRIEVDVIKGFSPKKDITDDEIGWTADLMNYYFCLAMVRVNPAAAISIMDDAGVANDSIEWALIKTGIKKIVGGGYEIDYSDEPVVPPTFSNDPSKWLDRGYVVKSEFQAGDVCCFNGAVGFFNKLDDQGLYVVTGFVQNSIGVGIYEDKDLINIIRA